MKQRLLNTTAVVFGLVTLVTIAAYLFSIPWRTFNRAITPTPQIIQAGAINEIWIDHGSRTYVNVLFQDGTKRKCTITTVGLFRSSNASAIIGRIDHGYPGWNHTAMDVGLPASAYWRVRWAGWSPFRHKIRIELS